ncbi:MAG: AMP-binding protein [Parvularculaceae bacterium]
MRLFVFRLGPADVEAFNAFEARTGHRILERYGMSEAGMIASNPLNGARIAGTVGFALPGVSIRIAGEAPGEVEVKGPNVCAGYWMKPDKTAEAFTADGWFKTGDVGSLDSEGRLTLAGREKDLIIAGGFNIYPIEIEQFSMRFRAFSTPSSAFPIRTWAKASSPCSSPTARKRTMRKLKPPYRASRSSSVRAVATGSTRLPRNTMEQVQKQALRERFQDAFV